MKNKKDISDKVDIKCLINSLLQLIGFKRGVDYQVFKDHLYIIKHPKRGKVLSAIKEIHPEYNFYWESPRVLRWF